MRKERRPPHSFSDSAPWSFFIQIKYHSLHYHLVIIYNLLPILSDEEKIDFLLTGSCF